MNEETKSPAMVAVLDTVTESTFGRKRSSSIADNTCVGCGGPAMNFNDELSRREYGISGFCQQCQDEVFG